MAGKARVVPRMGRCLEEKPIGMRREKKKEPTNMVPAKSV